ncbi:MAG: FAD-binding oxidoreductase [Actinomycetota bacterium]|nr:FAD-binding oxidoreductase [Actinomycetota bacterium]
MSTKTVSELKKSLAGVVGKEALSDDAKLLGEYARSLGPGPEGKPLAVVRPADTAQVQALVNLAQGIGLNLVPASSGAPRLRGGTVPAGEGVVVDLSGMDKIVRMDRRNKVVIIEPGVTFGVLKNEAERAGLKVLMPLLPRAGKSVLASYLEREPIIIPKYHWDMTDPMLCTEIVFGTGDLFRTGSAAGPGSLEEQWRAGAAQKNPMGPAQTDFVRIVQGAQGTMGIVTWSSIKLEILPRVHRCYFIQERSLQKLVDFSYRIMRPKLADEFLILNSLSLSCILGEEAGQISALAARQSPFTLIYGVAGYEYLPEKRVAYQEEDIANIAQSSGVDIGREVPGANGRKMKEILANPSPEPYWKQRYRGGFRDVFFLTTLDRTPFLLELMQGIVARHDHPAQELGLYIQPIQQGRSCHMEFHLFFDPSDEGEAKRVEAIFSEAGPELAKAGAFFSRPYGPWAEMAYERCPDSVEAMRMVKGIVDPKGVLNRGKLCF